MGFCWKQSLVEAQALQIKNRARVESQKIWNLLPENLDDDSEVTWLCILKNFVGWHVLNILEDTTIQYFKVVHIFLLRTFIIVEVLIELVGLR